MKIGAFVGSVCLASSALAIAQEALTNDSIEKMAKARLGDDVIVSVIQSQGGHLMRRIFSSFTSTTKATRASSTT
jgi:hypothetical protein